jgi:hypothetical protein
MVTDATGTATDLVASVIQRVYEDATQTALDRKAAREIIAALRAAGWASLDEVAVLIEAAGGEIAVPDRLMVDGRRRVVTRQDDFRSMGKKYRVSVGA